MLNPLLTTFLTVADCGSFTSASKRLFISATAVMKAQRLPMSSSATTVTSPDVPGRSAGQLVNMFL